MSEAETPDHDADLEALSLLIEHLRSVSGGILESDWSRPTPCPDWDLRQLVDHVVGGNRFTQGILEGQTADEAMAKTLSSFDTDPSVATTAATSLEPVKALLGGPGALDRTYDHVAGQLSGRKVLRLRLHDLLIHAWDIGRAMELDAALPPRLVAWGIAELRYPDSLAAQHFGTGESSSEVGSSEAGNSEAGDEAETSYLASFGRYAPVSYVSHLEAAIDGTILPHDQLQTLHEGRPLWVRYDLDAVGATMTKEVVASREPTMWRYAELLPVSNPAKRSTLGEGMTPILRCDRLGSQLGLSNLWVKDESQLPTGSFKSRGLSMAVSRANELGARRLAIPTAGNAGGAMAAYAARVGMEAYVFMPADTPIVNQHEAAYYGAKAFLVDGLITDCGAVVREGTPHMDWFDVSTLKEPYRIEGKKTMGLELAEQFGWSLPDVILYPTGGGTGLIGMWKAFAELAQLGWLQDQRRPRMISCQAEGCAPISTAWEKGERFAEPFPNAATAASGLRVPAAVGDFMILDAVNESGGQARSCPEADLLGWARRGAALEGIALAPETGACLGVLERLVAEGAISKDERVVIFNTGAAQKYVEVMASADLPRLGDPIDWAALGSEAG